MYRRNFIIKGKPDEVHAARFREGVLTSECVKFPAGVEHDEVQFVHGELTCPTCISERGYAEHNHNDNGKHCVEFELDCMIGFDRKTHNDTCHHCGIKLQLPYNWIDDSPAPQIRRRETY
ncbi:hypothetical protein AB0F25_30580 [Streptomyces wedmorensis]|uniref:hypothetical protein n=1 Tax=Streptomyces wedmorensis TaxID=43759 RepID=UPI00343FFC78